MLNSEHRKQLRESGIDSEFACTNGFRDDSETYIRRKFCLNAEGEGIEILYPCNNEYYYDHYSRIRLDSPIAIKQGAQSGVYQKKQTSVRYLSPKNSVNHLYIPKPVWKVLNDPRVPLIICEGEKKALKLLQEGYMAIGLPGIYGGYSKGKLLKDFDRIVLFGREIYIAFDGDKFSNPHVRKAEIKLANDLSERTGK